jgi:hypothetical protein
VRYVGHATNSPELYGSESVHDTQAVVFISSPSLAVPARLSSTTLGREGHAKTLLEFLYGYEAGSVRQPPFGAPRIKEHGDKAPRTLQVPETWFLLIGSGTCSNLRLMMAFTNQGPDILISSSELSSQELVCNNITVDRKFMRSTPGIYTVRVVDHARMCKYHIVIERDCKYAVCLITFPSEI